MTRLVPNRGASMHPIRWPLALLLLGALASDVSAQDVEMLGRRYGTRPPDGYFRELARNPGAYRFARGRASRTRRIDARPAGPAGVGAAGAPSRALGPRDPITGTFTVPLVLGQFADSPPGPPPQTRTDVQNAFFVTNPSGTVTDYYDQVSRGLVTVNGSTLDWVTSALTQAQVTLGQSALVCCGIGD